MLAVVSLPLGVGAALGAAAASLATRKEPAFVGTRASVAALVLAAVGAIWTSSVVAPPDAADALVALAVGLVSGHVLYTRERPDSVGPTVG